jgi:tRNA-Thr(GGU) m(6)t(6)A37 methyltransferase TsaA
MESFKLNAVGKVKKKGNVVQLQISDKYGDALKGLDGYSHVFVLYWFDRNDTPKKRSILQVYPRGNRKNPLTGVFACRAPVRPNLIALSLCKILSVEDGTVRIEKIDALDGSPILDLKPYIPSIDSVRSGVRLPAWLEKR